MRITQRGLAVHGYGWQLLQKVSERPRIGHNGHRGLLSKLPEALAAGRRGVRGLHTWQSRVADRQFVDCALLPAASGEI